MDVRKGQRKVLAHLTLAKMEGAAPIYGLKRSALVLMDGRDQTATAKWYDFEISQTKQLDHRSIHPLASITIGYVIYIN